MQFYPLGNGIKGKGRIIPFYTWRTGNNMKGIRVFCGLILWCFTTGLWAQTYIGIEGGGYFVKRQGDIKLGITSEHQLKSFLTLQPELVYIRKGTSLPTENLTIELDPDVPLSPFISYIQTTLTSRLKLHVKNFSLQLLAGPYLAVGLHPNMANQQFSFEALQLRRIDFGASIGSGLAIDVPGNKKMFVDFRYNYGLNDLDKDKDASLFNQGFSFTMGFLMAVEKGK